MHAALWPCLYAFWHFNPYILQHFSENVFILVNIVLTSERLKLFKMTIPSYSQVNIPPSHDNKLILENVSVHVKLELVYNIMVYTYSVSHINTEKLPVVTIKWAHSTRQYTYS